MSLRVVPVVRRVGRQWIADHHSHLGPPTGWLCGVAVLDDARTCCVAVLERPARMLQNGRTACISRVASDRTPHAASMAIGALTRAALALGYTRIVSYTLLGERGTPYRAAEWRVTGVSAGGEWSRRSRVRGPSEQIGEKVRWEIGPEAAPLDASADARMRAMVGKTESIDGR